VLVSLIYYCGQCALACGNLLLQAKQAEHSSKMAGCAKINTNSLIYYCGQCALTCGNLLLQAMQAKMAVKMDTLSKKLTGLGV
jgi:hypothetical protein